MENNKEKLEAMENTQNSPEALSDEQLDSATGGTSRGQLVCDRCGSTNVVVKDVFGLGNSWLCAVCAECGEILAPAWYL